MKNRPIQLIVVFLSGIFILLQQGCCVTRERDITYNSRTERTPLPAATAIQFNTYNNVLLLTARSVERSDVEQVTDTVEVWKNEDPDAMLVACDASIFMMPFSRLCNLVTCISDASDPNKKHVAGPLGCLASILIPFVEASGDARGEASSQVTKTEVNERHTEDGLQTPLGGVTIRLSAPSVLANPMTLTTSASGTCQVPLDAFLPAENEVSLLRDVQVIAEIGDARSEDTISVIALRDAMDRRQRQETTVVPQLTQPQDAPLPALPAPAGP